MLALLPDNSIVRVNYGLCLAQQDMVVEAEAQFRAAHSIDGQCCEAWHQHARILSRLGRQAEAAECFRCGCYGCGG